MYITAPTLDDLMYNVFTKIISDGIEITESKGGKKTRGGIQELTGVLLRLENPRARLSRTETKGMIFSALGEFLWYMAGTNDLEFIKYYIHKYKNETEDGQTVYGAYGPRLTGTKGYQYDQITNIVNLLSKNKLSKRAVVQIFDAADIADEHVEIPCTCTLQFLIRNDRLSMFTQMRSNDAYKGLPHDIFAFTMLQEVIARMLGIEIGEYHHSVTSLHIYLDDDLKDARQYLSEGLQSRLDAMPAMPLGDPGKNIIELLEAERSIRTLDKYQIDLSTDPYWRDLMILLRAFKNRKKGYEELGKLKSQMTNPIYDIYYDKLMSKKTKPKDGVQQLTLSMNE